MTSQEFCEVIKGNLPYSPNRQQELVIEAVARFCGSEVPAESVFMLNGYAGTGKTTLCAALVKSLPAIGWNAVLLAPTGRAAKVFSNYATHPAYTIHRKIYRHSPFGDFSQSSRDVLENKLSNTLFIIDEASMITSNDNTGGNVLEDLIHYVYTGENCRMLLLGDTAQLPPVGSTLSPAMNVDVLKSYGLRVTRATLTETARQAALSGILHNATWLRRAMRANPLPAPKISTEGFQDIFLINGEDMPEDLYNAYNRDGLQESIVITRSNQRAVGFNREIRSSVLYLEDELAKGELLIISKNNYHWTSKVKELEFLANGDMVTIEEIIGTEDRYGFRFADVVLKIPETEITFQAKIMLETLACETANISNERLTQLYYSIMQDPDLFDPYTPADARLKALRTNPHWNALHVKYGYAVTCHKAQGGQWKNVFVDMAYIPADAMGLDFYRWLYTAVSRARNRLYILGFPVPS